MTWLLKITLLTTRTEAQRKPGGYKTAMGTKHGHRAALDDDESCVMCSEESIKVRWSKRFMLFVLLLAAMTCSILAYRFLRADEEQKFKSKVRA